MTTSVRFRYKLHCQRFRDLLEPNPETYSPMASTIVDSVLQVVVYLECWNP
jgi:hypothetical protein